MMDTPSAGSSDKRTDLPIVAIQNPTDDRGLDCSTWSNAFVGDAPYVNSSNASLRLDGLSSIAEGKALTNAWLAEHGHGQATVTYKLRDWLFSRQRYWGEPFPIVYDDHGPIAVPESLLPVELPEMREFEPVTSDDPDALPQPPLARATDWVEVELDLGGGPRTYRREVNTMPQWAGSCWYYLRYLDPQNAEAMVDAAVERDWAEGVRGDGRPKQGLVDMYVGGVEHAVLHLLYARFFHKLSHQWALRNTRHGCVCCGRCLTTCQAWAHMPAAAEAIRRGEVKP